MYMLVTGAANGIGAAITAMAASQGHHVVATDIKVDGMRARWQRQPNVECHALDVTRPEQWSRLVRNFEDSGIDLDVLMNVAGVLRSGQTGQLNAEDVELMLNINVKGPIYGTNAVAEGMIQRGRGHIINVGSVASLYPTPGTTLYATSKFALRGFSIAAAGDLRPHGIAVTLVGPGPVKTAMLDQQRGDADAALTFSRGRALDAEEVATAILRQVLRKRPVEYFIPAREEFFGKLCNAFPELFLGQIDRARAQGIKNFASTSFKN